MVEGRGGPTGTAVFDSAPQVCRKVERAYSQRERSKASGPLGGSVC